MYGQNVPDIDSHIVTLLGSLQHYFRCLKIKKFYSNKMIPTSLSYQLAPAKTVVAESIGVNSSVYVLILILALYRSDNNI